MLKQMDAKYHLQERIYRFANEISPVAQIVGKLEFKKNIQPIIDSIRRSVLKNGDQIKNEPIYILKLGVRTFNNNDYKQVSVSMSDYSEGQHIKGLLHISCPINHDSPGLVIKHDLEGNVIEYTEILPNGDKETRFELIKNGAFTDMGKAYGTLATVLRYKDSLSFIKKLTVKQKFNN